MGKIKLYIAFILILVTSLFGENERQLLNLDIGFKGYKPYKHLFSPEIGSTFFTQLQKDSAYFKYDNPAYLEQVKLDSISDNIIVYTKFYEEDYSKTDILSLDEYKQKRIQYENDKVWNEEITKFENSRGSIGVGSDGIAIDIPFKIKSRTFNRVFGGNRIGLRVNGNISVAVSGSQSTQDDDAKSMDFKLDQTLNVSIKGKIGTKVDVDISQDSEMSDIENVLKISYTGDSDEIIKKIDAGNIGLSLPSTQFVTFSGQNKGLFGIKTETQVGNLTSTFIASLEKGEKNELEVKGGKQEKMFPINTKDYLRGMYYFVDNSFRENYGQNFENLKNKSNTLQSPEYTINKYQFKLYITGAEIGGTQKKADLYVDCNQPDSTVIDSVTNLYRPNLNVVRVEDDKYYFDPDLGYIILDGISLSSGQFLAVTYEKVNSLGNSISVGSETSDILKLQIIGEGGQSYKMPWANLEWKNVYSLGGVDVSQDGFKLEIKDIDKGNITNYDKNYLKWFDVSDDSKGDNVSLFYLDASRGTFVFPSLKPFDPEENLGGDKTTIYTSNLSGTEINTLIDPLIYKKMESTDNGKYTLNFKFTSKSNSFDLGFNVIEGSEVVKTGSNTLVKDVDYIIDYNMGQLTIINTGALTSDLTIKYESASIFQLDSKLLLGTRSQYNFSDNIFIGASVLYLSESTKDTRVHIGYEPKKNIIWDFNGKAEYKMEWLTKMIDLLPLIETDKESNISFEGEYAQVIPNPNPLGIGYVDDFESSQRKRTLGITYQAWHFASYPDDYDVPSGEIYHIKDDVMPDVTDPIEREQLSSYFLQPSSQSESDIGFYWYNYKDEDKYKREDIYENTSANEKNDKINTLNFRINPSSGSSAIVGDSINYKDEWGGVMKYMPGKSYQDLSDIKYMEILISSKNDVDLHIDLGSLSEDVIPNGILNSEDQIPGKKTASNNILDVDEDIGLDMMNRPGSGDFYFLSKIDTVPEIKKYYESFSFDKHPYLDKDHTKSDADIEYYQYNKTSGNRKIDTEDLDGGGNLDREIAAYRYTIPSIKTNNSEYLVSDAYNRNFRLYRIPLDDAAREVLNNRAPDMEKIYYLKLWFNNSSSLGQNDINIVSFDFVGNEWKASSEYKEYIEAKTVNTEDNKGNYTLPPGMSAEKDDDGNLLKEQSLLLDISMYDNLGSSNFPQKAFITKKFIKGENYIEYKTLKMFVHAGATENDISYPVGDNSDLYFAFKFGKDSANYYQYMSKLERGWSNNQIILSLDSLTKIKEKRSGDTHSSLDKMYLKRLENIYGIDRFIGVVGNPSLRNIAYLQFGIIDSTGNNHPKNLEPLNTEIWIDEFRLADIKKESGTAMRVSASIKFADFANVSAQVTKRDANFHTLNQRIGSGRNQLDYNVDASVNMDKFFPQKLGMKIPISGSYINNYSYTKYKGTTDILTDEKNIPDSVKTKTITKRIQFSIDKTLDSKNKVVNYTLDKLTFSGGLGFINGSDPTYSYKETQTQNYNTSYSFVLPKEYLSYNVFAWTSDIKMLRHLRNEKFEVVPLSYNFRVSTDKTSDWKTIRKDHKSTTNETFLVTRNFTTNYNPFSILKTDYTLDLKSDMYKRIAAQDTTVFSTFENDSIKIAKVEETFSSNYDDFLDLNFGQLSSATSTLRNNISFNLTKWMHYDYTHNINYSWNGNLNSWINGRTLKNSYSNSFGLKLNSKTIITSFQSTLKSLFPDDEKIETASVKENKKPEESKKGRNNFRNLKGRKKASSSHKTTTKRGSILDFLKKNLRNVNLSFIQGRENTVSNRLSFDQPDLKFMTSLINTPADGDYNDFNWNGSWGFGANTGISISRYFNIDGISYNFKRAYARTNTFEGSDTDTRFVWPWVSEVDHEKGNIYDKYAIPIPNYSISITGLEKFVTVKDLITSIKISHAKTGSKTNGWYVPLKEINGIDFNAIGLPDVSKKVKRKNTYSLSFAPLVSIDFRFKNGFNFSSGMDYSFDMDEIYDYDDQKNTYRVVSGSSKKYSKSFRLVGNYNQRGGFQTPFNFWPFNGKRLNNDITYNMAFVYTSTKNYKFDEATNKFDNINNSMKTDRYSLTPGITYKISQNLNGSLSYTYTYSENKDYTGVSHTSSNQEIEFKMMLTISGH